MVNRSGDRLGRGAATNSHWSRGRSWNGSWGLFIVMGVRVGQHEENQVITTVLSELELFSSVTTNLQDIELGKLLVGKRVTSIHLEDRPCLVTSFAPVSMLHLGDCFALAQDVSRTQLIKVR